jgi:hypothetical protein
MTSLYRDLHTLRNVTAWASGQDLGRFSEVKSIPDLYKLSPEIKKVTEAEEYFLIYQSQGMWDTSKSPKKGLSFWEALKISKEWESTGFPSQIVPETAWKIVKSLSRPSIKDISFEDGFMYIKDVNLPMCRWFSF